MLPWQCYGYELYPYWKPPKFGDRDVASDNQKGSWIVILKDMRFQ